MYNKTVWQDRVVANPNRYAKSGETASSVTLVADPGTVTQAGTPLNAGNLNKIEQGIADVDAAQSAFQLDVTNNYAKKVQQNWIAPTLLNAWANDAGTAGYYKDEFGQVRLRGAVKGGAANATIFTLPIGYRPLQTASLPTVFQTSFGFVLVLADGTVRPSGNGAGVIVYLDSVSFRAEQ